MTFDFENVDLNATFSIMLAGYTGEAYLQVEAGKVQFSTPTGINGSISTKTTTIKVGTAKVDISSGYWTVNLVDGNIASMRPTIKKVG